MDNLKQRYFFSSPPNQSIAIQQCGLTIYKKGQEVKSALYNNYAIHFILSGKGIYTVNDTTYHLGAGQGFLIVPDTFVSYRADRNEPWKYIYATFSGLDAEALINRAGLDESNVTFSYDMTENMLNSLYSMFHAGENHSAMGYDVTGYFLIAMSQLVEENSKNPGNPYVPEHHIRKAISFIENNYNNNIRVSDISDFVHINRTYLHRLFVKNLNISPTKYLLYYRLNKAATIIEKTDLSFNDIAMSCGFYDASHFYKAFNARYNMSPGEYRLKTKNDSK